MNPTLQDFRTALTAPDLCFRTLNDCTPPDGQNDFRFLRTTHFIETTILWHGQQWLLSMPLSDASIAAVEKVAAQLKRVNSEYLSRYLILPREMRCRTSLPERVHCDMVIQLLPEGIPFEEALLRVNHYSLDNALDELYDGLRIAGLTHNNLKAENLRWCGDHFVALRYHDAYISRHHDAEHRDMNAIMDLHDRITRDGCCDTFACNDVTAAYTPPGTPHGHLWKGHPFEGLTCVKDPEGYGYVDADDRIVIKSQYLWADDFHEGRATVETPSGMGLIDKTGRYVLAPEYEIVEYLPEKSLVQVRKAGLWAWFDYLGKPLTDFGGREETRKIIEEKLY